MKPAAFATALLLLALPASAHDLWLVPARFSLAVGETVEVEIQDGEPHKGESERLPRNPLRFLRFAALEGEHGADLLGIDGRTPAGFYRASRAGNTILVYEGVFGSIELPAEKFAGYLLEEGLDVVVGLRAARGESTQPGRERYRRGGKALLSVGGEPVVDRALGLPLELVLERASRQAEGTTEITARLLFEGLPLAGALVELTSLDAPGPARGARSDAEGRVRLPAPAAGRWLLTAVHMVPAPAGTGADWESSWTSLSWAEESTP